MYIRCASRCYCCKAPLRMTFITQGEEMDWLYTWILKENIDLGFNIIMYKKVDARLRRICYCCYYKTEQRSLTDKDIFDWIDKGKKYVRTVEKDMAPLLFILTYWLTVPGLYAWYHQSTPRRSLINYADLDM